MALPSSTRSDGEFSEKTKEEMTADEKIPETSTQGLMLKLQWVKNTGEAMIASNRLRKNALNLATTFFSDGGKAFREGRPYYQEYAVELLKDQQTIERLQSSEIDQIQDEVAILKEDMEAFLNSPKMKRSIASFVKQNKEMMAQFRKVKNSAGPMFDSLVGMVIPTDSSAEGMLKNIEDYLKTTYNGMDPKSKKARRGTHAAMYIIASIFHNNDTKFAFLYDNEKVIKHMGQYVTKKYGSNPLLTFAVETAPFIDVVNRNFGLMNWQTMKATLSKYKWYLLAAGLTVGTVLGLYPKVIKPRLFPAKKTNSRKSQVGSARKSGTSGQSGSSTVPLNAAVPSTASGPAV